jgi:hypothetical protein
LEEKERKNIPDLLLLIEKQSKTEAEKQRDAVSWSSKANVDSEERQCVTMVAATRKTEESRSKKYVYI